MGQVDRVVLVATDSEGVPISKVWQALPVVEAVCQGVAVYLAVEADLMVPPHRQLLLRQRV